MQFRAKCFLLQTQSFEFDLLAATALDETLEGQIFIYNQCGIYNLGFVMRLELLLVISVFALMLEPALGQENTTEYWLKMGGEAYQNRNVRRGTEIL